MNSDEAAFTRKMEAIMLFIVLILSLVICYFRIKDLKDKLEAVNQKQDSVHLVVDIDTELTFVTAPDGFHYEIADDGRAVLVND